MSLSMPPEIRRLVRQAAISTAAYQRDKLDDSAWVVRAVCEKLQREWESLGIGGPLPGGVEALSSRGLDWTPVGRVAAFGVDMVRAEGS
jgi:hypothetical protein